MNACGKVQIPLILNAHCHRAADDDAAIQFYHVQCACLRKAVSLLENLRHDQMGKMCDENQIGFRTDERNDEKDDDHHNQHGREIGLQQSDGDHDDRYHYHDNHRGYDCCPIREHYENSHDDDSAGDHAFGHALDALGKIHCHNNHRGGVGHIGDDPSVWIHIFGDRDHLESRHDIHSLCENSQLDHDPFGDETMRGEMLRQCLVSRYVENEGNWKMKAKN